jgi:hypothetical protein
MHLDHVSYATSHDSIVDVIQRIGSQLGASFIDGGIHPQFGTRNFILPLKNSRYIEVVCPLDHPASDKSPFGQLVTRKAEEGGGWLTWVIAVDDVSVVEKRLEREAVSGHRKKPDGKDLYWRQIGVLDTLQEAQDSTSSISLSALQIYGDESSISHKYGLNGLIGSSGIHFEWIESESETGIQSVSFNTPQGSVVID